MGVCIHALVCDAGGVQECAHMRECVTVVVSLCRIRLNLTLESQGGSWPAEQPCDFSSSCTCAMPTTV